MNTTIAPFGPRRLASILAFVAGATILWADGAYESLRHASIAWEAFGVAALVGAAAYGVGRASAVAQVLSRAVGWAALAPAALVLSSELTRSHRIDGWAAAFAASMTLGLAVSRPLLDTERARRDFHPIAVRRALLSGSIASIAVASWVALGAIRSFESHHAPFAVALGALAAALAASGVAIVRMRGWGVLLAGVTSMALVAEAILARDFVRLALVLAAVPGAVVSGAVLFARWSADAVAPSRAVHLPPIRTRIAADDELFEELDTSTGNAVRQTAGATIA